MGWQFGIKWGDTGQVTVSPLELKAPHSLWGKGSRFNVSWTTLHYNVFRHY